MNSQLIEDIKCKSSSFESPQLVPVISKKPRFGKQFDDKKKTLVLDLDKTLVHITLDKPTKSCDYLELSNKGTVHSYITRRPGLNNFLSQMSIMYNICIFTTNKSRVAEEIVKCAGIAPYICELYTRQHCQKISEKMYLKSLMLLGFSLANTILVDDSLIHMRSQPLNGILIQPFVDDKHDTALDMLAPFLSMMAQYNDVRPVTQRLFAYFEKKKSKLNEQDESQEFSTENLALSKSKSGKEKSKSITLPKIQEENEDLEASILTSPVKFEKRPMTFTAAPVESTETQKFFKQLNSYSDEGPKEGRRAGSLPTVQQIDVMHSHILNTKENMTRSDSLSDIQN